MIWLHLMQNKLKTTTFDHNKLFHLTMFSYNCFYLFLLLLALRFFGYSSFVALIYTIEPFSHTCDG